MNAHNVFNRNASRTMVNWDINEFKKTHRSLYNAIIESIEEAKDYDPEVYTTKMPNH